MTSLLDPNSVEDSDSSSAIVLAVRARERYSAVVWELQLYATLVYIL